MLKVSMLEANEKQITEVPFKSDAEAKAENKGCCNFMQRLWQSYNHAFLASLGLQYFNNGFDTIIRLAYAYRFLNYYVLSPSQSSQY